MLSTSTDSNIADSNGQHDEHINENGDPKELRVILFDDLDQWHRRDVTFLRRAFKRNK